MASRRKSIRSMANYRPTYTSKYKQPKLTLLETTTGEANPLSLKGIRVLQTADAVVHDGSISSQLNKYVQEGVPVFNLAHPSLLERFSQKQINDLLVDLAFVHGHVVRLLQTQEAAVQGLAELANAEQFNIVTAVVAASEEGAPAIRVHTAKAV